MKKYPIFVSALALALFSCNGKQTENKAEENNVQPAVTEVKADTIEVTGKLTIGHEVRSFKADNDTIEYWFIDRTGKVREMYEELVPEGMKDYTPVKTELKVVKKGKSDDGFAADYDGTFEIVEVLMMEKKNK